MGAGKRPAPEEDRIAVGKVVEMIEGLGFILRPHHLDDNSRGELRRFREIAGVLLEVIRDPEVTSVLERQYKSKLNEGEFAFIFSKLGYDFHRSGSVKVDTTAAAFVAEEFLSRLETARLIKHPFKTVRLVKPPWP
jgi:hypothetical protein